MENTTQVTMALSHFGVQNTPPLAQKIGDACLLIATAGAAIVAIPAMIPVALPVATLVTIAQVGIWTGVIGTIGKFVSKFFGVVPKE